MMSLKKVCVFILIVSLSHGKVPSIRLCGDKKCESIISTAKTAINYNPIQPDHVAFRGNTPCRVMSKSIGDNSDLWEIEVQGRRGYAPKKMLMEQRIIVKAADLIQVGSADEPDLPDLPDLPDIDSKPVENATISEESVSLNAEPQDVPTTDEQVTNDNVEQSSDAEVQQEDVQYKNSQEKKREIYDDDDEDDDDDDENEYLGQLPADEPLAIKRDMYKTGKSEDQNLNKDKADIHLEVVGLNANEEKAKQLEEEINEDEGNEIENENEKADKVDNLSEENIPIIEENIVPVDISQEQSDHQNSLNDQPLNDNTIPPKIEEHQNNDEQYTNESFTANNKIEEVTPIKQVESTVAISSEPVLTTHPDSGEFNINESQLVENDSVPEILSTTSLPDESEIKHDAQTYTKTNAPESSIIDDVTKVQLDNYTQEIENKPEYLADNSNNEIPSTNSLTDQMQQDANEYYTPKPIDISVPEPVVTTEQIHLAVGGENIGTSEPSIETTKNIIAEQKPEIIENEVHHTHDHTYDSVSPLPPSSSPQLVENEVRTDDIFSPHFQPETPSKTSSQIDESNWYDGILIFMEDTFASIKKIFDKNSSENGDKEETSVNVESALDENGYCENMQGDNCPKNQQKFIPASYLENLSNFKDISNSKFVNEFLTQIVARAELVVCLLVTAAATLIFLSGYYCLGNQRKENVLIEKLNILERKLIVSQKECSLTKGDLVETTSKLNRIADKSFGTDDMIKQYESEKNELCEQVASLEKELETAAEAGLELNKMVQELLSNQSGSDSIINSVEELQHQLNEQEANMIYINNLLAEKSRENSELQVLLADTNQKFGTEMQELLNLNKQLGADKETLEKQLNDKIHSLETELKENEQVKSSEISNLKEKHNTLKKKYDEIVTKWRSSAARAEALEETLKKMESFNGKDDIKTIIEATDANAKYIALKRETESLSDQLESEIECKNRLQQQIKELNDDITRFRAEFNQNEKDKLEAETRLEVLSNYFKEKESQLQKELNIKEALFMKQQGESTTTVDKIRYLQEDIQKLRSQNDELRAEIEAQAAAHKAQISAAEVRAHDSWLAAKQAERRLEEARSEASILRKKLTSLTTFNGTTSENNFNRNPIDGFISDLNVPSPIHLESPSSPGLPPLNLPPPPLIPAPMYSGMTPFMPPPPLPLPNEMRPAPLGRLMSPPPPDHRFVPNFVEPNRYENNRYSPDDYPGDLYETETDFSPPRSPPRSPDFYRGRNYRNYSPEVPSKKKSNRKGSSSDKSSIFDSDEWDRQTF